MKEFENDKYKLILHEENHLMEFIAKKNVIIEEEDIWESRNISCHFFLNTKYVVLFESVDGSRVSANGRRAVASEEYFKNVAALAIYSNKAYESVRGNLFSKVHRPVVPTKFFYDREKAMEWLKYMSANR